MYRACDIRGKVEVELSPSLYRRWGVTLGRRLKPGAKFVIGGDVRGSTPEYLEALAEGLCQAGLDVVDLGILPTPMVDYARRRVRAAGSAVVTASHNPADINGLKWTLGDRPPTPEEVARLKGEAEPVPDRPPGARRSLDISFDYVGWLQQRWVDGRGAPLRVVLDSMHGCLAARARRYLHAVFPHAVILVIRDRPDPTFGGQVADCSRPELLEALAETVDHERADLGIAFDGDGDRIALVDNDGIVLRPEEAAWALLHGFGDRLAGQKVVLDQKFSDRVAEVARELGSEPVVERSGHAFIRSRMLDAEAVFGAELSGHFFYGELAGGDDPLFTACRLIAHLAQTGRTLAQLRRECPPIYVTPDLRLPVDPPDHQSVMDHVQATWLRYPQRLLDGVRVDFPEGWALVRSSVTEPAMTFRFESTDGESLDALVWRFCDALPRRGDALWARYEDAMGRRYVPCRREPQEVRDGDPPP